LFIHVLCFECCAMLWTLTFECQGKLLWTVADNEVDNGI